MSEFKHLPIRQEPGAKFVNLQVAKKPEAGSATMPADNAPYKPMVRVDFLEANSESTLTSLWCDVLEDGIVLQHDYIDFKPLVGWKVRYLGKTLSITKVDSRNLTCGEVK